MAGKERTLVTALVLLLLVLWGGFVIHRSPRFAGSLAGGVLAVSGSFLMVFFAVGYAAIKRIPSLKRAITQRVAMRTWLAWHVYTAAFGSIVALLHTGHKFQSWLGIALTATLLIAVLSGYIARHFLNMVSLDVREKQDLLQGLQTVYDATAEEFARQPPTALAVGTPQGTLFRWFGKIGSRIDDPVEALSRRAVRLAESIADVEYAVKMDELLRKRSSRWLTIHLLVSCILLVLLALHVWASIHFGLRWFG